MAEGIDYEEINHNAKCLAELLFPGEPVMQYQSPDRIMDLIIPGYISVVKKRLVELQKQDVQDRSR